MRIFEEFALLLVDDENGALRQAPQRALDLSAAGAVLIDLEIAGRIDSDPDSVVVLDESPLGDGVLDRALRAVAGDSAKRDIAHWVKEIASWGDEIVDAAISNLVRHGVLDDPDDSGVLGLASAVRLSRRYAAADGSKRELPDLRIQRVLFSDEVPDAADAPIISLANACGLFAGLLTEDELERARGRIDDIGKLSLVGQVVARAIAFGPPEGAGLARTAAAPRAKGHPVIGNLWQVKGNMVGFLVEQYEKLGPVFRIGFIGKRSEQVMLAGREANLFLTGTGQHCVTIRELWRDVVKEFDANRFLFSMDGADHVKMRRLMRPHFSAQHALSRVGQTVEVIREGTSRWPEGQAIPGMHQMQSIFTAELISLATGKPYWEYVDDVVHTMNIGLSAHLSGIGKFRLKSGKFRAARRRVDELYEAIMGDRRLNLRRQERSVVDSILSIHESDSVFLPEVDFKLNVLLPMIAGSDTAGGAMSFMLYHILTDPDLYRRVQAEADELFARDGGPSADGVRKMVVLPRVMMETLRMHPIVYGLPRRATTSFDFAGYRIEAGQDVTFASAVTHFLDEFFPDPGKFDIDRYAPERGEHKLKGAYAPFGLGRHGCLGGNLANAQAILTIATLLHDFDLVMDPPDYKLRSLVVPLLSPDQHFKFKAARRRG